MLAKFKTSCSENPAVAVLLTIITEAVAFVKIKNLTLNNTGIIPFCC